MKLAPLKFPVIVYKQFISVVVKVIALEIRRFSAPSKSIVYYMVVPVEVNIADVQAFMKVNVT